MQIREQRRSLNIIDFFAWNDPGLYFIYDPNAPVTEEYITLYEGPPFDVSRFGLLSTLAFSPDGLYTVYVSNGDNKPAELWISDIRLCHPTRYYSDDQGWVSKEDYAYGRFAWGPGNQTVIFYSQDYPDHIVVHRIRENKTYLLQSACNEIVWSKDTGLYSLGCPLPEQNPDGRYALIQPDGSIIFLAESLSGRNVPALEYAFGPTGDRAALLSTSLEMILLDPSGGEIKLPLYWNNDREDLWWLIHVPPLQWSSDGTALLAYSWETTGKLCPPLIHDAGDVDTSLHEQACWMVLDGQTGEVVWYLKQETAEKNEMAWEHMMFNHAAAISADGQYVVLQYREYGNLTRRAIIAILDDQVLELADGIADLIVWSPR